MRAPPFGSEQRIGSCGDKLAVSIPLWSNETLEISDEPWTCFSGRSVRSVSERQKQAHFG